jgi:hypothetical protein
MREPSLYHDFRGLVCAPEPVAASGTRKFRDPFERLNRCFYAEVRHVAVRGDMAFPIA